MVYQVWILYHEFVLAPGNEACAKSTEYSQKLPDRKSQNWSNLRGPLVSTNSNNFIGKISIFNCSLVLYLYISLVNHCTWMRRLTILLSVLKWVVFWMNLKKIEKASSTCERNWSVVSTVEVTWSIQEMCFAALQFLVVALGSFRGKNREAFLSLSIGLCSDRGVPLTAAAWLNRLAWGKTCLSGFCNSRRESVVSPSGVQLNGE